MTTWLGGLPSSTRWRWAKGSFFRASKAELAQHRAYATRDEAKRDLFAYIGGFYKRYHMHIRATNSCFSGVTS